MREGKVKARRSGAAGSSPFFASQKQQRSSVFSRDPGSSQTEIPDDVDEVRAVNGPSSSRNLRSREARVQTSADAKRQERHKELELRLELQRPGATGGKSSSAHPENPFERSFSSEAEVAEGVERPFPSHSRGRHVTAAWPLARKGGSRRTVNSSPSRPANRDDSIDISDDEEEEPIEQPIEQLPRGSRLLSPDEPPPKVPPKPSPSTRDIHLSKTDLMRRKDGSRRSEPGGSRPTMSKTPRSELLSSKLPRTSATPAAVAWAFIVVDSEEIPLRVKTASLRCRHDAPVLELFGADGKPAELPLHEVTSVQVSRDDASATDQ